MQPRGRGSKVPWLPAALLALATMGGLSPVWGHATLEASQPAQDAHLAASPKQVVLKFSEAVVPVSVTLLSADGQVRSFQDSTRAEGSSLIISIAVPLREGAYLLSYRAISADSHPVSGSLNFTVGDSSASAAVVKPLVAPARGGIAWRSQSLRALETLSLLLALGGVLYRIMVGNPGGGGRVSLRRQILFSTSAALVLEVLFLISTVIDFSAGGLGQSSVPAPWGVVIRSSLGVSSAVALLGLTTIIISEGGSGRWRLITALIGTVLVAGSRSLTGHAHVFEPRWVLGILNAVHFLMVGYWYGSMPPLLQILIRGPAERASSAIERFSRAAMGAVPLIVLSGFVLIAAFAGSVKAIVATTYGQLFLGKLTLFAAVISLAAINKLRLTPALSRRLPGADSRLRRLIAGEFIAMTTLIVVASVMSSSVPPVEAVKSGAHLAKGITTKIGVRSIAAGSLTLRWQITRTLLTDAEIDLDVRDSNGALKDIPEADVELTLPERGVEAIRLPLARQAPGHFVGHYRGMLYPGHWNFRFAVLISEFERVSAEDTVEIQP